MVMPYRCLGLFEPLLERMPGPLARPIGYAIVFVRFQWKLLLVATVIAFSAGTVGAMFWDDLPRGESFPALLVLTALCLLGLWQWNEASHLREQLRSLQEELREEESE